jgi:hypothetical protein
VFGIDDAVSGFGIHRASDRSSLFREGAGRSPRVRAGASVAMAMAGVLRMSATVMVVLPVTAAVARMLAAIAATAMLDHHRRIAMHDARLHMIDRCMPMNDHGRRQMVDRRGSVHDDRRRVMHGRGVVNGACVIALSPVAIVAILACDRRTGRSADCAADDRAVAPPERLADHGTGTRANDGAEQGIGGMGRGGEADTSGKRRGNQQISDFSHGDSPRDECDFR